jgi:hypothetical protein
MTTWFVSALDGNVRNGRIDNGAVRLTNATGREECPIDAVRAKDMENPLSGANEIIGDDPPVTAPPDGFRAHTVVGQRELSELRRLRHD